MRVLTESVIALAVGLVLTGCTSSPPLSDNDMASIKDNYGLFIHNHVSTVGGSNDDVELAGQKQCAYGAVAEKVKPGSAFTAMFNLVDETLPTMAQSDKWLYVAATVVKFCPEYEGQIPAKQDVLDAKYG